jgi:hypothetical protein
MEYVFKHLSKRLLTNAALTVLLVGPALYAAPTAPRTRVPVQAALVKAVEAGRVKTGDAVLAKVEVEWKSPDCTLRKGSILKGRIVSQTERSKAAKNSEIALLFESAECGGRVMRPFPLTVTALIAPDPGQGSDLDEGQQSQPLSDAVGLGLGGTPSAGTGSGFGGGGGQMRSIFAAAATAYVEPPRFKPPKAVMPGQVVGLGSLKLSVATGPEESSVLSNAKRNVRLDVGSQFVLSPTLKAESAATAVANPTATTSSVSSSASSPSAAATPEPNQVSDETEICTPPQCSVALAAADADLGTTKAAATLSVKELGYPSRPTREMTGFDYDAAIAYLGPKELLFTFNPHQMVPRAAPEGSSATIRIVRGAVINMTTMKVEKMVDWRIPDFRRYLWPMGHDGVLIHSGSELRMYGPGLKLVQKLPLDGPLAYVQVSPSGGYFVVGVVQERHSAAIHRQLEEAENREPEEDVKVKVLDSDFHTLATVVRSSREAPPVLSDTGEIRVPTIGKDRWRIVEYSWNAQRRVIAQISSTCRPEATSLPPDLLFVVGCDRQGAGKWYRMLRPDGKPVLKGWSPSAELEQIAEGSPASGTFAIGVARATNPVSADSVFHAADLQSEYVGVYGAGNGRRVFGVGVPSPVPSRQTFALSPNGDQLAVLRESQIEFYALPGTIEAQK